MAAKKSRKRKIYILCADVIVNGNFRYWPIGVYWTKRRALKAADEAEGSVILTTVLDERFPEDLL